MQILKAWSPFLILTVLVTIWTLKPFKAMFSAGGSMYGFMGVSFAIPIDVAMDVANQLKAGGKVSRGWFFFKQKTAYEIADSDWSSDVCSSDLVLRDSYRRRDGRCQPAEGRWQG